MRRIGVAIVISACLVAMLIIAGPRLLPSTSPAKFHPVARNQNVSTTKLILLRGHTACQPIPELNAKCPDAATLDDITKLEDALKSCAPNVFSQSTMTDSGFGYEALASSVSAQQLACIKSRISTNIKIMMASE